MNILIQTDGRSTLSIKLPGFKAEADGFISVVCLMVICVAVIVTRRYRKRWG